MAEQIQELKSIEDLDLLESGDVIDVRFSDSDVPGENYQGSVVFVFNREGEYLFVRHNKSDPRSYFIRADEVTVENGRLVQKPEAKIGVGEIIPSLKFYNEAINSLCKAGRLI